MKTLSQHITESMSENKLSTRARKLLDDLKDYQKTHDDEGMNFAKSALSQPHVQELVDAGLVAIDDSTIKYVGGDSK